MGGGKINHNIQRNDEKASARLIGIRGGVLVRRVIRRVRAGR